MSQNTCQIKAILCKDTSGHQHMEGMWSPDNYSDSNATEMKQAHTRTHTSRFLSVKTALKRMMQHEVRTVNSDFFSDFALRRKQARQRADMIG